MAPQHDEIVKQLGDGFAIAWDTTKVDRAEAEAVRRVAQQRATALEVLLSSGRAAGTTG